MAKAEKQTDFDAPIEKVFQVLSDYNGYPEFMDGVNKVTIERENGDESVVEFSIDVIKKFTYTLTLKATEPNEVSWSFVSGDLFKRNDGHWKLTDNGDGTTHVDYLVDVDFKMMVPGMVTKKLVSGNLPRMMKQVEAMAKKL